MLTDLLTQRRVITMGMPKTAIRTAVQKRSLERPPVCENEPPVGGGIGGGVGTGLAAALIVDWLAMMEGRGEE